MLRQLLPLLQFPLSAAPVALRSTRPGYPRNLLLGFRTHRTAATTTTTTVSVAVAATTTTTITTPTVAVPATMNRTLELRWDLSAADVTLMTEKLVARYVYPW